MYVLYVCMYVYTLNELRSVYVYILYYMTVHILLTFEYVCMYVCMYVCTHYVNTILEQQMYVCTVCTYVRVMYACRCARITK